MSKLNSKGLTLIEVIISLAIIGVIIVSFLTMFSSSYDTIFSMGRKTEATRIAQEVIDYNYDNGPINGSPVIPSGIPSGYIVTIINPPAITNNLSELVVTVSYRNNTRSVTLTALVP